MFNSRRRLLRLAILGSSSIVAAGSATLIKTTFAGTQSDRADSDNNACLPLLRHKFRPLMGSERRPLCNQFSNQVLLVVNTASRCGFTPQFEDLEKLHTRYSDRGLRVLGFPSGDFRQELSTEAEVAQFCELNYGVTFPMFEKIHVTGEQAHPFYQQLAEATGSFPRWNFNKYLIKRNGVPFAHYDSGTLPMGERMISDIEALL